MMRMMPVATGLLVILASEASIAQDQDQEARIAKLIQDLGADDFKTREAAEEELRKIGAPAAPALRKALDDKDAERADRARKILADVEKKPGEKKPGRRAGMRISVRNGATTFDLYPDGRVELTVPEEDRETGKKVYKTYKADSLEEFKEKYPELAKQHSVERFIPRFEWKPLEPGDFDKWWEDWKKRFDEDWFGGRDDWFKDWKSPFDSEELKKWREEQRRLLDEMRRRLGRGEPPEDRDEKRTPSGGGELGIKIEPVNETLAAQLDLKEGEGVQLAEVKPGSLADKAGLKKHDVLLKFNGKAIADKWEFRKNVRESLGSGFELEIVRNAKRETIKVKPEEK